ncbi:sulfotransferase 1C4-like [Glandiceps talaboti]
MGDRPKAYTLPGDYEHRGTTYSTFVNRSLVESPEIVDCRPDDVFIATYPKSGTTVTIEMMTLLMNGGDVEASKAKPQLVRTPMVEMYIKIPFMAGVLLWFFRLIAPLVPQFLQKYMKVLSKDEVAAVNGMEAIKKMPSPRLIKTHLPYHHFPTQAIQKKCKIVYVARNPKDVAYSFYHHMQVVPDEVSYRGPWKTFFETYLQGKVCWGDWFDHVLGWWEHKDEDNILYLKYEDFKKDPRAYIRKIAVFLDVDMPDDMEDKILDHCSIKNMKQNKAVNIEHLSRNKDNEAGFIRKGIVGDWRNHLTVDQNRRLEEKYEERMKGSGLDFDW